MSQTEHEQRLLLEDPIGLTPWMQEQTHHAPVNDTERGQRDDGQ